VRLILCSLCLNYYHLIEPVQVGIIRGMPNISEARQRAEKVISI
jgi:hypothetical protein